MRKFGYINANEHTPRPYITRYGIPTCNTLYWVVCAIVYNPPAGVTHSYIGNAFNAFK